MNWLNINVDLCNFWIYMGDVNFSVAQYVGIVMHMRHCSRTGNEKSLKFFNIKSWQTPKLSSTTLTSCWNANVYCFSVRWWNIRDINLTLDVELYASFSTYFSWLWNITDNIINFNVFYKVSCVIQNVYPK